MKLLTRLTVCAAALMMVIATAPQTAEAVCSAAGTVSDVTACVPVGKGSKDCYAEWSITLADGSPPPPKNGFPTKKVSCVDNDPLCDLDVTPGQCTFSVGLCVNVSDTRIPGCTPTDAATFDFGSPSEKDALKKSHKDPNFRANRRGLLTEMDALLPTATGDACTAEVPFVVTLKKKFKDGIVAFKKGKAKIKYKQADAGNNKDSDSLSFTCLPNEDDDLIADIDTQPIASARQIVATNELIGGPLAMGQVGDYLIENDKARFILRGLGREFSFNMTYGGHLIDADIQRKAPTPGSAFAPPYPAGKDDFLAITPLINVSSTDNPSTITIVNSGAAGGDAILRTEGPDDLLDSIDPDVAVTGFFSSLSIPDSAHDKNIDVTIVNEYTLSPGDHFMKIETIIQNDGGSALPIYIGDYTSVSGQQEVVGPGLGFGLASLRTGGDVTFDLDPLQQTYDYLGWVGFGASAGLSYALIPELYNATQGFGQAGVFVPLYGQNLVGVLQAGVPPVFTVPASPGTFSYKRWLAVSTNGMGQVLDARHTLVNREEIPLAGFGAGTLSNGTFDFKKLKTGTLRGTVTAGGEPVDGARVVLLRRPGDRGAQLGFISEFETKDGGYFQGTFPKGKDYIAMVHIPGHAFEDDGITPAPSEHVFKISGGTTTVDFVVDAAAYVRVLSQDNFASNIASKISVVGLDLTPDPQMVQTVPFLGDAVGNIFGYLASDRVDSISGLADVRFAGSDGDSGVFPLPAGDYQFVVSHGIEYDVHDTSVVTLDASLHTKASPFTVNAVLTRVVDTTGFVGTDHHVHMLNSPDSVVTRDERIVTMLAEGVDYFVSTDHDFIHSLSDEIAALKMPSGAIADVSSLIANAPGDEITTFDSGHFNAYPLPVGASHTGNAVDWGDASSPAGFGYPDDGEYDLEPDAIGALVKAPPYNAIVFQANHFNSPTLGLFQLHGIDTTVAPPASSVDPTEVRLNPAITNTYTDELTALELWIESSLSQNARALGENMGDWFNMLNNFDSSNPLLRKTAIGDSDTHSLTVEQAGGPRTMIALSTDDPASINPNEVSNNINAGRAILTSGPFVQVTLVNTNTTAQASHVLADPLLVASDDVFGTTDRVQATIEIHSPTWAPFDTVEVFVRNVPNCVFPDPNDPDGPNFLGALKPVCAPDKTLFPATNYKRFNTTPNAFEGTLTVSTVAGVDGGSQLEGTITPFFINAPTYNQDFWVVVVVSGNDNESASMFPMNPNSMPIKACTFDECQSCTSTSECGGAGNTCDDVNPTVNDLATVTATECGVRALAITNPLFVDADADGLYEGVVIP